MTDRDESPGGWVERERVRILQAHADEALELRGRARRCFEELLAHEVELLVFDGFSPGVAEQAARINQALRAREIEAELHANFVRIQEEPGRKLERLREDAEAGEIE